jgi:hypothetical protein
MAKIENAYPLPKRGSVVECEATRSIIGQPPWATAHGPGGFQIDITNGGKSVGQNVRVRLETVGRSLAIGEALNTGKGQGSGRPGGDRNDRGDRGPDRNRGSRQPSPQLA